MSFAEIWIYQREFQKFKNKFIKQKVCEIFSGMVWMCHWWVYHLSTKQTLKANSYAHSSSPAPPVFPSWFTFLFIFSLSLRMCVINQFSACRGGIPLGFLTLVLLHLDLMSTPVCHQLILLPLLKLTEVHQKMSDPLTNTISAVGSSPMYVCYVLVLWLALISLSV